MKKIIYCWFGKNPIPEIEQKCIESWRRHMPDWEIVEINEDNFDVNAYRFTREAYAKGQFAYVSDYARLIVLKQLCSEGHEVIYLDTDVFLLDSIDSFVEEGPFFAKHIEGSVQTGIICGWSCFAEAALALYDSFFGSEDLWVNDALFTQLFRWKGYAVQPEAACQLEKVGEVTLVPFDVMTLMSCLDYKIVFTENSKAIHFLLGSWFKGKAAHKKKKRKMAIQFMEEHYEK